MPIQIISSQIYSPGKPVLAKDITSSGFSLDFASWLPFAAECYNISKDPKDYLLYPVPILYSDIPNRNGIAMPLAELLAWNRNRGCQAYATWRGMPMFAEHKSDKTGKKGEDEVALLQQALGVIADVALRPITGFGGGRFWKVMALAALDRSKGAEYVSKVEKGIINSYSMGAMVNSWSCSYCGAGEEQGCRHIDPKKAVVFYELNGRLVYKNVHGIDAYELSIVADPAYATAFSDLQLTY